MTNEQRNFLREHHLASGKYASEQEIAVSMVHRINEALNVLRTLEVNVPLEKVVYHHYNHSVEQTTQRK